MRTFLLAVLGVLLLSTAAWALGSLECSDGPEYNDTANATCERKDPFDEYIYHAPLVTGINLEDNCSFADWAPYSQLQWAGPMYSAISQACGPAPTSDADYSARFKLAWGYVEDWPVLYIAAELIDSDQAWDPMGSWNTMDVVQFWYSEHYYDYDAPITLQNIADDYGLLARRQMNIFGIEGFGIRMNECGKIMDPPPSPDYCIDPNQPYTIGDQRMTGDQIFVEAQVQLFYSYESYLPWVVTPGETCLGIGFSGFNDFDPNTETEGNNFSYMTWGQSVRGSEDARVMISTVGFEDTYDKVFGTGVESTTWGAIKSAF